MSQDKENTNDKLYVLQTDKSDLTLKDKVVKKVDEFFDNQNTKKKKNKTEPVVEVKEEVKENSKNPESPEVKTEDNTTTVVDEIKTVKEKIYRITFYTDSKQEVSLYSKFHPIIDNHTMYINEPFGQQTFVEVILGKFTVKESCKREMNEKTIEIPVNCVIKSVDVQEWMFRTEEETKDFFDQKVLNKYRELSKTVEVKTVADSVKQPIPRPSELLNNQQLNQHPHNQTPPIQQTWVNNPIQSPPLNEDDWWHNK